MFCKFNLFQLKKKIVKSVDNFDICSANYVSEGDDNTDDDDDHQQQQEQDADFEDEFALDIIEKVENDEEEPVEEYLVEEERLQDEVAEEHEEHLETKVEFDSIEAESNKSAKKAASSSAAAASKVNVSHANLKKNKEKCRVCLDEYHIDKMYDIFDVDNTEVLRNSFFDMSERLKINEKVEYCCGVRIRKAAHLPSKICIKCFDMIRIWFNFRQVCVKSQIYLENQGKKTKEEDDDQYLQKTLNNIQNFRLNARNKKAGFDIDLVDAILGDVEVEEFPAEGNESIVFEIKPDTYDESMDHLEETQIEALPMEDSLSEADAGIADDDSEMDNIIKEIKEEKDEDLNDSANEQADVQNKKSKSKTTKQKLHYKYRPPSPESYMCSICGNVYNKKATFTHHMNQHSNVKPHNCE